MADPKLVRVTVGDDGEQIDASGDKDSGVIVGIGGQAFAGEQGLAYAGAGGTAKVQVYGVAIAGPSGTAWAGAGSVACAYDGGTAIGGDGSVAWARRAGPARVDAAGMASALDSQASGGNRSVAVTTRQNATDASAEAGPGGVAVAYSHPKLNPASGPATAIAIAFDGNWVRGELGSLLIGAYSDAGGQVRFVIGTVDGQGLLPNQSYAVDANGMFQPVA
jgi:hypothetical protein